MSLDLDNINGKYITQAGHSFVNTTIPQPAYVSSTGDIELALANNVQTEAFGLVEYIDANTIFYYSDDDILEIIGHGFTVGDILYLQDDGTLGTTPGTFIQKIFEVIDNDCLNYLKQPMNNGENAFNGVAKIPVSAQTITNTGAVQNDIDFNAPTIDSIGVTVAANIITLPSNATYNAYLLLNFFDNNSARAAHRVTPIYEGVSQIPVEGENYMRDATAHDNSSIDFSDLFTTSGSNIINYQIQSHSSLVNTSNITSGYLIIEVK